jgi:type III restriction enzyme
MFYKMIQRKRDMWYSSSECTIDELISYIVNKGEMRDVQIDAIKTYLYLKIACENKQFHLLYLHPISPSLSNSPTQNKS